MIIAVDFDGVIARDDNWPQIGNMILGAKEAISKLREDGNFIIVNTCRSNGDLVSAINWMLENGIGFDLVNENHPDHVKMFDYNSRKIFADIYIDDRNLGGFPGWNSFMIRRLYDKNIIQKSAEHLKAVALRICTSFDITFDQLISKSHKREFVDVRWMLYRYGRMVLGLSFSSIGKIFNRNHCTVLYGIDQTNKLGHSDRSFCEKFEKFKKLVNESYSEV
jgi:Bacterial dnaA protein helix-turn-helix